MILERRRLDDLGAGEIADRRAFVRVDFNVPLQGSGDERRVASDVRIRAALPTIRTLRERGAITVLASHLGRPAGERDEELSMAPVAGHLEEVLGRRIVYLREPFDDRSLKLVREARGGEVFLLENLRFEPGETANDPEFAARLAGFGQAFVQDAFGTCHRAHASTVGVAEHLSPRVAGRLVESELAAFARLLDPERPFVAVIGGAKISGKLEIVRELLSRCDRLALGGGMANTFLAARGIGIGDSLVEEDLVEEAGSLLEEHGEAIVLPTDAVVARRVEAEAQTRTVDLERDGVDEGWRILDVGPGTVERVGATIDRASTVFWNGPLGVFETPPFDAATNAVAERLARATDRGAYTVTGGGDSLAALENAGLVDRIGHASTGGGAALELVSGRSLPGVEALDPPREEERG